jgi:hypothetical protein
VNGIKQIIPHKVWILPNQEMSAGDETQINYEPRRDRLSLFNLKIKNIRGVEFILK